MLVVAEPALMQRGQLIARYERAFSGVSQGNSHVRCLHLVKLLTQSLKDVSLFVLDKYEH